jgi:hypothetical protein
MKNIVREIFFGRNSMIGGVISLTIILGVGLGCFCNKDKIDSLSNGPTPSGSPTPSPTPTPEPTKEYKPADASKNEIPTAPEMQDIVKKTMLDFNDALQQEDFTDFHASVAKLWQKQTNPEKMKGNFQNFIDGEADFGNIRSMKATFTREGEITRALGVKTLETEGEYPTSPNATTFKLKYIAEKKEWKLVGLEVNTNVKRR